MSAEISFITLFDFGVRRELQGLTAAELKSAIDWVPPEENIVASIEDKQGA